MAEKHLSEDMRLFRLYQDLDNNEKYSSCRSSILKENNRQVFILIVMLSALLDIEEKLDALRPGGGSSSSANTVIEWKERAFSTSDAALNQIEIPTAVELAVYARGNGSVYSVNDIEFTDTDPPLQATAIAGQTVGPTQFKIVSGTIRWGVRS